MSFDRDTLLELCEANGRVARVVIAEVQGSAPREVGAAMLIWRGGQAGTIGGGALEYELAARALNATEDHLSSHALGPDMGQCCGGRVKILTEVFDVSRAKSIEGDVFARGSGAMPLSVSRVLAGFRNGSRPLLPRLIDDWMVEPLIQPGAPVWVWGAGHVGRAVVSVLGPLPNVSVTWIDVAQDRFPSDIPAGVTVLPAARPETVVTYAPKKARHLIVTYSHALDLALCDALLHRGFDFTGLIGSATKWARFRKRLAAMGHRPDQVARITCPIGNPSLGKHPQQIALGVGVQLLQFDASQLHTPEERRA